ncbi:phage baseplate protein [Sphingobacterium spiritivorum]|uniref:phage baseplate protein n=1 Tax=Sphingobacterium spiritivorum TaxID=258 RepID=UPI003DA3849C
MKELIKQTGGYKRHMDYLLTLQSEVMGVQNAMLKNLGHDLVLSGCEITDHQNGTVSIAPGVVYVSGQIVRFAAAANIASDGSKCMVLSNPVQTDPDDFFDGTTKNTYKEVFAQIGDTSNQAQQIVIVNQNLYGIRQYVQDIVLSYGQKGEIKDVYDYDSTFMANFDSSGLGITPKWIGWAIMNGNNGTPNASGRVRLSVGSIVSDGVQYNFENGTMGGTVMHKLTQNQMPKHRHGNNHQTEKIGSGNGWWALNRYDGTTNPNVIKYSDYQGGDEPHNNMQPYIAIYSVIKIT